jgi:small subunit ribosomal protein S8
MDTLANALNVIKVSEHRGNPKAFVEPASKITREVLMILQKEGYIGEFEFVDDGKSGKFIVGLLGKVNNCGAVKPQYHAKTAEWEKYEQRYLPGRGIGIIVVSTSQGIMTHAQAKEKKIGGKLLAFAY